MKKEGIVYWEQLERIVYNLTKWAFALAFVFMVFYVVYQMGYAIGIMEGRREQSINEFFLEKDCVENNNLFITKPDTNGHST